MNINNIFKLAAEKMASDVHLLVGHMPIFRINGVLTEASQLGLDGFSELTNSDLDGFLNDLLTKEQKNRFIDKRDLDLGYQVDAYRYRVNCAYEKNQVMIVARIIDESKPTLDDIGFPPLVRQLLDLPQGFVLITGPTGCGKSTSLAAMINYINDNHVRNIITLEDPIEYIFKSNKSIISQRQLGTDMLSFASGLKHVLRQDPNVIMLGEMRDPETIATAVTLAETGHLVLATLHTRSAAQTIDRIIDSFPPHQQGQIKSQLSSALSAVISQRLLPRRSGGRIAAREILINNSAVANLIREGKIEQIKSAMETGSSFGMITIDRHIKELYNAGEIEHDDAQRHMDDPDFLDE